MTDLHANRAALEACFAHADRQGVGRYIFLGDYVGYGADPDWVVGAVMDKVAAGAIALQGNHDEAIFNPKAQLNPDAMTAIAWTRPRLDPAARAFLQDLPLEHAEDGRLFTHADATEPRDWGYVMDGEQAMACLHATHAHGQAQALFCGHVHIPTLYGLTGTGKLMTHRPTAGVAIPLPRHRRWLAVLGSVGQPRDGNPAASYAILDPVRSTLTFCRVPYDVEASAERVRAAGLPDRLADRLLKGR